MMRINFYFIFFITIFYVTYHCKPADLNNPSDPTSSLYQESILYNFFFGSTSKPLASYSISGTVSGLVGTVTISNGSESLTITADGAFIFTKPIQQGSSYSITVTSQPVGQICTIANSSGNIQSTISNISIVCANSFTISGTIYGLLPASSITLLLNGSVTSSITGTNGIFSFSGSYAQGSSLTFAISSQPSNVECIITNSVPGTMPASNITNLAVTCPIGKVSGIRYNRCSQGQTWDGTGNGGLGNCTGAANQYQYCSSNDNNCNSLNPTAELESFGSFAGGSTSSLWTTCNSLNGGSLYGIITWRVPTKAELKALRYCDNNPTITSDSNCVTGPPAAPASSSPTIDTAMFPATQPNLYWTSTSTALGTAFQVQFGDGSVPNGGSKTGNDYVRCVSN